MSPGITAGLETDPVFTKQENSKTAQTDLAVKAPGRQYPKLTAALSKFDFEEVTPQIGREYPRVNIVDDLLKASNADDLLLDLAITVSRRGVVFFRSQDNLSDSLQKTLVHRLGQLTGKPSSSSLHIHPVLNSTSEFGVDDNEISTISSLQRKAVFKQDSKKGHNPAPWHSDIQFEGAPADYTSLRLTELPSTGGDTLWASGYELYERFSPAYRAFLDGLTATFVGAPFLEAAKRNPQLKLYAEPRGSPENVGTELTSVHPVVRTNPVTGWKSIFSVGEFPKRINELYEDESAQLLAKFLDKLERSHDLQVRFRWKNKNDFAIWDNRSVFHVATYDHEGFGERTGHRTVGIGEVPFFDPESKARSEALAEEGLLS